MLMACPPFRLRGRRRCRWLPNGCALRALASPPSLVELLTDDFFAPKPERRRGKPRQHEDISTVEALLSAADVAGPLLHEIGRDLAEKHGGEYKGAKTKGEVRVDTREGEG